MSMIYAPWIGNNFLILKRPNASWSINETERPCLYPVDGFTRLYTELAILITNNDSLMRTSQVENIGATISINHNWFNACNLQLTLESLIRDLADVKRSIQDVRESMNELEFTTTCQQLLLMHSGWDWSIFLRLLRCVARRLASQTSADLQPDPLWQVQRIETALNELTSSDPQIDKYLESIGLASCIPDIRQFITRIS